MLPLSLGDLKVGERVAIHTKSNADKKLVAVTVKLGPADSATVAQIAPNEAFTDKGDE